MRLEFCEGGGGIGAAVEVVRVGGVVGGEVTAVYVGESPGEIGVLAEEDGLVGWGEGGLVDDGVREEGVGGGIVGRIRKGPSAAIAGEMLALWRGGAFASFCGCGALGRVG